MNTMHNDEPFYCDTCDYISPDENIIQEHVKQVHKTAYQERVFFPKNNTRRTQNQTRLNTNSNVSSSSFPSSVKSPITEQTPADSMPTHEEQEFHCEECKRYFTEKDHFQVHMEFYHGIVNIE